MDITCLLDGLAERCPADVRRRLPGWNAQPPPAGRGEKVGVNALRYICETSGKSHHYDGRHIGCQRLTYDLTG